MPWIHHRSILLVVLMHTLTWCHKTHRWALTPILYPSYNAMCQSDQYNTFLTVKEVYLKLPLHYCTMKRKSNSIAKIITWKNQRATNTRINVYNNSNNTITEERSIDTSSNKSITKTVMLAQWRIMMQKKTHHYLSFFLFHCNKDSSNNNWMSSTQMFNCKI